MRRNNNASALKQAKANGAREFELEQLLTEGQRIRDRLAELKEDLWRLEETDLLAALRLPNVSAAENVPVIDRTVYQSNSSTSGTTTLPGRQSHIQLMADNDLGEFSPNR